ncbi:uncharacterized protein EAE97_009859 [Botrytis byssoidea]|uniref:Uncharacterized protein n=1 Tax=Botrytis byssoidea TaxID=139641 RepID=A0A9P5I6C5_9HELO|nr:uncharacterized protein EAE97_009859 [Botrytis byssoidea]KAF7928061.1 hypothetical protein EAE97_009859 [Botrytis byssoidea]
MAPSGKGYPPPIPRVLRSKPGDRLPPPPPSLQLQPSQPPNQASNTFSGSSKNPSPTFPSLTPRFKPRDIDPRLVSGPTSQPQCHQETSRASSRIRSRTGSSRPPTQNTSLSRPRDLVPRPRPRALLHLIPRPRLTPMDRDLFLGQDQGQTQAQQDQDQDQAQPGTQTRAPERLHFQGQGQFQIQHQAQPLPRIDPQIRVQNHDFYANSPYPFATDDSPFSQSQTTIAPGNQNLHYASRRDMHQPQSPTEVHSETQNRHRDQNFHDEFPFPFPTPQNPFSNFQAGVGSRDQDYHRGTHRGLDQDEDEIENEISTQASKCPRLSYSDTHPNSRRIERSNGDENIYGNIDRDGDRDRDGTANEDIIATQNERYDPNDTSSESPLSTPPDSVSSSPPLPALRNHPRIGTFTSNPRFDRYPTSRIRTRGGYRAENGNGNVIASRTETTNPHSPYNPSNPFTEPPVLPSTLDGAYCPTAAQKKWMCAVRAEGKKSDRNENGGFGKGIEGQMVRLFGGGGEWGV